MPKQPGQKLKLLYLQKILTERTDEEHPMTVQEMIDALSHNGIVAERKAIYDDLEQLSLFGLDLIKNTGKTTSYYVGSRLFEVAELKLLADAVACSKFITEHKSGELIQKIDSLAGKSAAGQIARQVVVKNRVKTQNEQIYYNVDTIHNAIAQKKQISFDYFTLGLNKEKQYRDGKRTVSPYALSWEDENYYLICYYEKYNAISHFRVDKMEQIRILIEKSLPEPKGFQLADYSKKVFSMFGGKEEKLTLRFQNDLVGVVFDKFGTDILIQKDEDDSFTVHVTIAVSNSFFGWMFQFGDRAEIISPQKVKDDYKTMARRIGK